MFDTLRSSGLSARRRALGSILRAPAKELAAPYFLAAGFRFTGVRAAT